MPNSLLDLFDQASLSPSLRDPSQRKHGGDAASQDAFEQAKVVREGHHREIIEQLRGRGEVGMTAKEYAAMMGIQLNCCSGRFSELNHLGLIVKSSLRRQGAAVWVLK